MTIPYGRQDISEEDVVAVVTALRSDFLTQGPAVPAFERKVAVQCGASHAVAVNSATSALHIACLALGVGPGDIVWTSPITFVASANCALYCGAKVDFVDISPETFNMSVGALEQKLERAEREGALPKVIIPVHMAGQACEMEAIAALASRFGCRLIEDASHGIGGYYQGDVVGCCRYSDITIFSFHPVKIVTSAEGGMALTNDSGLAERMSLLRSHGITRDPRLMRSQPHGDWYYEQVDLGFNYRMTDLQAALGASQLDRLNAFVDRRHVLAERYNAALAGLPLRHQRQNPHARSAYHLYLIRVAADKKPELFDALRARGIGVNVHYIPVHLQPFYIDFGFKLGDFPEAELYYRETLTLPLYPQLQESDQDRVIAALEELLFEAGTRFASA